VIGKPIVLTPSREPDMSATSIPPSAPSSRTVARDLRYDFLRGLALIAIYDDHLGDKFNLTWLKLLSLRPWGLSSGAELFVFISGSMVGLAYSRHLVRYGWTQVVLKALKRTSQLYLANNACILAVVLMAVLARWYAPSVRLTGGVENFLAPSRELLVSTLTMRRMPQYFDILPLYVVLIAASPLALLLMTKDMKAALGLSFTTYVLAHVMCAHSQHNDDPFLDPLAWQFLFVIGMSVTCSSTASPIRLPRNRALMAMAAVVAGVGFLLKLTRHLCDFGLVRLSASLPAWQSTLLMHGPPLTGRVHLEPIRLLHLLSCAYLFSALVRKESPWLRMKWAQPFVASGANSLKVFCFGLVLTYADILVLQNTRTGTGFRYALVVGGAMASLVYGLVQARGKARRPSGQVVTSHLTPRSISG
jgi:hypothetical protein